MRAEELRIGNLLFDKNNKIINVRTIYVASDGLIDVNGYYEKNFKPIPITEEYLLKLGFVNNKTFTYTLMTNVLDGYIDELEFFFEQDEEVWITLKQFEIDNNNEKSHVFFRNINYIHQLQNLYFALTGTELTLK